MIPEKEICAIIVNVIMYICCLFTYPVPINEVVEQASASSALSSA